MILRCWAVGSELCPKCGKEQSELSTARQRVADWAQQEPGTSGPSVYLANLLEEKGQLEAALEALKPALALQPKTPKTSAEVLDRRQGTAAKGEQEAGRE